MRKLTWLFSVLVTVLTLGVTWAASPSDYLVFAQVDNGQKTLYASGLDGVLTEVVSGKDVVAYIQGKHFLYYTNHQLYDYDFNTRKPINVTQFKEDEILLQMLPGEQDQALVIASDSIENHWYILEFSDGSLRRIEAPPGASSVNNAIQGVSPDEMVRASIKPATFDYRFQLQVQEKIGSRYKTVWTLPRNMTILPELPIWSPDSRRLAFYGKEFDTFEGFYALYYFDLDTKKLNLIQEQVFSRYTPDNLRMDGFTPDWSDDSKSIIFQYQPYGLPTESTIIKYDLLTAKKTTLISNPGSANYPSWSQGGKSIFFLSNRETEKDQLYIMDQNGQALKRISPATGYTEWAKWYKPSEKMDK